MGIFSDHYGRKKIIVLTSLIHITSSILTSFSNSFSMFVGIRFFVGGSIHAVWSAYFVLMAEIAPASKRTLCGGANTLLLLPRMIFFIFYNCLFAIFRCFEFWMANWVFNNDIMCLLYKKLGLSSINFCRLDFLCNISKEENNSIYFIQIQNIRYID